MVHYSVLCPIYQQDYTSSVPPPITVMPVASTQMGPPMSKMRQTNAIYPPILVRAAGSNTLTKGEIVGISLFGAVVVALIGWGCWRMVRGAGPPFLMNQISEPWSPPMQAIDACVQSSMANADVDSLVDFRLTSQNNPPYGLCSPDLSPLSPTRNRERSVF
ncbi:hypothetical protein PLICRDRAFT_52686 [Plicaturopsis crispa FD-325 SS-3]|nr:hypothetical protein PLICRDRAFT_52686 [Plicaturopsis crispa FD-325 SS-3]